MFRIILIVLLLSFCASQSASATDTVSQERTTDCIHCKMISSRLNEVKKELYDISIEISKTNDIKNVSSQDNDKKNILVEHFFRFYEEEITLQMLFVNHIHS